MSESKRGFAVWVATVGGLGYLPLAPGTWGSLVGVGLSAALAPFRTRPVIEWSAAGIAIVVLFFLGVWAAGRAEIYFGKTDPSHVIIDEVAGQMVGLAPALGGSPAWWAVGFILFRIFDIAKPFPASRAERLPRGWGIMIDDVAAGTYTALALAVIRYFIR